MKHAWTTPEIDAQLIDLAKKGLHLKGIRARLPILCSETEVRDRLCELGIKVTLAPPRNKSAYLSVTVPHELHEKVRLASVRDGMHMTTWIIKVLEKELSHRDL